MALLDALDKDYDIGEPVGSGGHGAVHRAVERSTGRAVAIKVLHQRFTEEARRRRFAAEVESLRRCADHRGVVTLVDACVIDDRGVVITELMHGSLDDRIRALGPLSCDEVLRLAKDLAAALQAIHSEGITHRDVKPANVFLDRDGHAVLGDFGVASVDTDRTITGSAAMSLAFAAPETIEASTTSPASDLYGFGVVLATALLGHHPFAEPDASSEPSIGSLVRRISDGTATSLPDHTPASLRSTITQLMAVEQTDRPTADDVQRMLSEPSLESTEIVDPRKKHRRWLSSLAAAAALLTLGGVVFWTSRAPSTDAAAETTAIPTTAIPTTAAPTTAAPPPTTVAPTTTPASAAIALPPLDAWQADRIDPTIATATIDADVVQFEPVAGAPSGPSHLRSEVQTGDSADSFVTTVEARFDGGTAGPWFQHILAITDDRGSRWTIAAQASGNQVELALLSASGDVFDAQLVTDLVEVGSLLCLRMELPREGPVTLSVDGEVRAQLDTASVALGQMRLELGPSWLEGATAAPTMTLALASLENERSCRAAS